MRRLLVTGATGFVGSHLLYRARFHWKVYGTFKTNRNAPPWAETMCFDLATDNPSMLLETASPDRVVHTAAIARTAACHQDPDTALLVNTKGTERLAAACAARQIPLIFLSTDMVFDGENPPFSEESIPNPQTVYGKTKLEAEEAVRDKSPDATIVRSNLVYGHGIGWGSSFSEHILEDLEKDGSVMLFEDQYRSPISVRNLVNALLEIIENPPRRLLHVSGPERVSRHQFGSKLARIMGISPERVQPNKLADRRTDIQYPVDTSFDINLATSILNTRLLGIEEGLELEYKTLVDEWIGKV
jgi:dTDP-4-dehydrorhamnose reductase